MVNTAASLIQRQGYCATGVAEIVAESGTPKGSVYYYFPGGKEELAAEAVRDAARTTGKAIEAALRAGGALGGALDRLARLFAMNLERSGFRDGCPVATIALEVASDSALIREACAGSLLGWRELLVERMLELGCDPGEAVARATVILAAFEGALLLSRALRDTQPLFEVAKSLTSSWQPEE